MTGKTDAMAASYSSSDSGSPGRSRDRRIASSPSIARLAKRAWAIRDADGKHAVSKTRAKIGSRIPSWSWMARLVQPTL